MRANKIIVSFLLVLLQTAIPTLSAWAAYGDELSAPATGGDVTHDAVATTAAAPPTKTAPPTAASTGPAREPLIEVSVDSLEISNSKNSNVGFTWGQLVS